MLECFAVLVLVTKRTRISVDNFSEVKSVRALLWGAPDFRQKIG